MRNLDIADTSGKLLAYAKARRLKPSSAPPLPLREADESS
jgi:hypothetical protein